MMTATLSLSAGKIAMNLYLIVHSFPLLVKDVVLPPVHHHEFVTYSFTDYIVVLLLLTKTNK